MSSTNGDNKRGKYREYSSEDRLKALAALEANKGNVKLTARLLEIPEPTLNYWIRTANEQTALELEAPKKSLADKFEELAHQLVDRAPDFINADKTTLAMVATAAGIATDKAQLLRGNPTQIVDNTGRAEAVIGRICAEFGRERAEVEQIVMAQPEFRELGKIG